MSLYMERERDRWMASYDRASAELEKVHTRLESMRAERDYLYGRLETVGADRDRLAATIGRVTSLAHPADVRESVVHMPDSYRQGWWDFAARIRAALSTPEEKS